MNVVGPSLSSRVSRASSAAAPAAATPAAEAKATATPAAEVRGPADAATVDAARTRAVGAEDAAKARVLHAADVPAAASQAPARGLLHDIKSRGSGKGISNEPGTRSCLIQEAETVTDPATLLHEIAKRGSGKQINDDGSQCAPITSSTVSSA